MKERLQRRARSRNRWQRPRDRSRRKRRKKSRSNRLSFPEVITIKELADKMKIVPSVIVKKLFMQGKVVTVNQES